LRINVSNEGWTSAGYFAHFGGFLVLAQH